MDARRHISPTFTAVLRLVMAVAVLFVIALPAVIR